MSKSTEIVRKSDGSISSIKPGNLVLEQPATVKFPLDPQAVARYERVGNDLLLVLKDGSTITVGGFFLVDADGQRSELVLEDPAGASWRGEYDSPWSGFHFTEMPAAPEAGAAGSAGGGLSSWTLALLGVAGVAGAAAIGSGGGHDSPPAPTPPPPAPTPTIHVAAIAFAGLERGEDGSHPVSVSGNSTGAYVTVSWQDLDGATHISAPVHVAANGTWTLDIARDQLPDGRVEFTATVTDAAGKPILSNGAAITDHGDALVDHPNVAPTFEAHAITTVEDTPATGHFVGHDLDGDNLTYLITTLPAHGWLVLDEQTGAYTYTPVPDYHGSDSFMVTVTDGLGGSTRITVPVEVTSVNDPVLTSDRTFSVTEETSVQGQIFASDGDGDALDYQLTSAPAHGSVVVDAATGLFVYTPNADYSGGDRFVVTISDGHGSTSTSTITLDVLSIQDAPVSSDQILATDEDVALVGTIVSADADGDTLTYSLDRPPAHGTIALDSATGAFTYTPAADYHGSDDFTVVVRDPYGNFTTSTITVAVAPVNDVPVTAGQSYLPFEDLPITSRIFATDADGDALSYSVASAPAHGTLVLDPVTGWFTYTPASNYHGNDSFAVTVDDGHGGSATRIVSLDVQAENDAPVTNNQNLSGNEDASVSGAMVATDVDGDTLRYSVFYSPSHGTVTVDPATGTFTYTPNANFNGSDSFTLQADDGHGYGALSTVQIQVAPANDAPVAADQSLSTFEDTRVNGTVSASDLDGDTLSFSISGTPSHGTVVLNSATGNFTYTPSSGYTGGDSFVIRVSDGHDGTSASAISIDVIAINHVPVANNDSATLDQDSSVVIAVRGNDVDPDGDSLTITGVTQGASGSVVIDVITGNPIYTPNAGFSGHDAFTYTINDGQGGSATATVNVTVNALPTNEAPVAAADTVDVAEGGTATTLNGGAISVLANDSDPEGNPLSAVLVTGPAHGTLTFNANGTFSYTHDGSKTTSDSFSYRANDGTSSGNVVSVNIAVTPVNDAPIAHDDYYTINEDQALQLAFPLNALTVNDTDPDGDAIWVYAVGNPSHGSFAIVGGSLVFTPAANFHGAASFSYSIVDTESATSTATVHIEVLPVNDAPIATADHIVVADGGTATLLASSVASVLANDYDIDGDPLTAILVAGPTNGSLILNANGTFSYTHDGSETTTDSFSYMAHDGHDAGNVVNVSVEISTVANALAAASPLMSMFAMGSAAGGESSQSAPFDFESLALDTTGSGAPAMSTPLPALHEVFGDVGGDTLSGWLSSAAEPAAATPPATASNWQAASFAAVVANPLDDLDALHHSLMQA